MATSLQTSSRVRPLHQSPQAQAFQDRDGDVWVPTGQTADDGQLLMECPEPQDPRDAGEGESFRWTWRLVETAFGPLKPVSL